jgi:DNA invertase Pin-like site-specific DNA recombinase
LETEGNRKMATYGYARVSTGKQTLISQLGPLGQAGCSKIIKETKGSTKPRPLFEGLLRRLQPGDVLVVVRLDRAFRSVQHALSVLEDLRERGVYFRCLTHTVIDTRDEQDAVSRLLLTMLAAVAQFEKELNYERTMEGLAAARARGQHLGRRFKLTPQNIEVATMLRDSDRSLREIAAATGVSKSVWGRYFETVERVKTTTRPYVVADDVA